MLWLFRWIANPLFSPVIRNHADPGHKLVGSGRINSFATRLSGSVLFCPGLAGLQWAGLALDPAIALVFIMRRRPKLEEHSSG